MWATGKSPQQEMREALETAKKVADETVEHAEATAESARKTQDALDREMERFDEAVRRVVG